MPQEALRRAVAEVSDAVQAGALTTLPLHRFPLERAAEAHVALENGAVGKVLIDVP
jgi:NADPH2:quinone reductase